MDESPATTAAGTGHGTTIMRDERRNPTAGWSWMPIVPHYPSDEPEDDEETPDFGEIVDRILNGGDDPTPVVSAAGA